MIYGTTILLRPVTATDLRQLRGWEEQPEVSAWLTTSASSIDARESPEQEFERLLRLPRIKLLSIQTRDGGLVGQLRLHDLDLVHRKVQVRLFIAPEHQRHGYGSDALRTVLQFCFDELALHRVGLVVRADHSRARRIYEQLGFQVEGCEREAAWSGGHWVDFVQMGMLAHEWRSQGTVQQAEQAPEQNTRVEA